MSVFIIAEAGVNHNGDINLAKKLIDVAVEAGADAVKFQTWKTEKLVTKNAIQAKYQKKNAAADNQYDMLKKLELSYEDFIELKKYCDEKKIIFMSTPDEEESALFLKDLQDIFKIGSGELTNLPFLQLIGSFNKRVILSTGMGTLCEIEKALNTLIESGTKKENITVLHATTSYPTKFEEVNLKAMLTIQNAFKIDIGYSDHTLGIEVPIAAVAMGAKVIEKHFTLDKNLLGPDHKASLEPDELKAMVKAIRNIEIALGDGVKKPTETEKENKKVVRKIIVAKKKIKKGEKLSKDNLILKRAYNGLGAEYLDLVLGMKAIKNFEEDEPIRISE
jgi:N-acetylneuraminate synthase